MGRELLAWLLLVLLPLPVLRVEPVRLGLLWRSLPLELGGGGDLDEDRERERLRSTSNDEPRLEPAWAGAGGRSSGGGTGGSAGRAVDLGRRGSISTEVPVPGDEWMESEEALLAWSPSGWNMACLYGFGGGARVGVSRG